MYDVPSMCSTANRKTNSFKDNVKVQNSKMGNSLQKHTHTQQQQPQKQTKQKSPTKHKNTDKKLRRQGQ